MFRFGNSWGPIQELFIGFSLNAQFGMFCLALFFLFTKLREDKIGKGLVYYTFALVFIVLFPVTATFLQHGIGAREYWRMLWLFPVNITLAYVVIHWTTPSDNRFLYKVIPILTVFLLISTSRFDVAFTRAERAQNLYNIPNSVIHVSRAIIENARDDGVEEIRALVPAYMSPFVRQYTAKIHLPFRYSSWPVTRDRITYPPNHEKMMDMLETHDYDWHTLTYLMRAEGINYLVLSIFFEFQYMEDDARGGFCLVKQVDNYAIFRFD